MVISLLPNCPCLPLGWLTAQPRPLPFLAILGALLGAPTQRAVTTPGSWCLGRRGPRSSTIRRGTRGRGGIPLSGDLRPFLPSGWEEAHRMVLRRNRAGGAGGSHSAVPRSIFASLGLWGNLRRPFQTPGPVCSRCPASGKGKSGTSGGPVCNNKTILRPRDVISQTCAQPPLSQAWGTEVGGRCERQEAD